MPPSLHLADAAFLWCFVLVVGREEPFIVLDIAGTEVRRLVVVRSVIVVEQLESREAASCDGLCEFLNTAYPWDILGSASICVVAWMRFFIRAYMPKDQHRM